MREQGKHQRYVLLPGKTKFLGVWDVVTTLALAYTAILTPFEASFLPTMVGAESWVDGWFLVNRFLDVVFLVDMILQFFIAYEELDDRGATQFVVDHRRVITHYLTSWFALDAFTIFLPAGFDFYLTTMEEGGTSGFAANLSILRVLRCVRLTKLVRLIRASRIYERWKSRISLSHAQSTALQILVTVLLSAHWCACIMGLNSSLHETPQDTWMGESQFGICKERPVNFNFTGRSITSVEGCDGLTPGGWYVAAFAWSVMVITGAGGTDFYPSAYSEAETLVVAILVLVGALLWTQVLALFCDVRARAPINGPLPR